jgi:signal transduction histidine kinase
MDKEEELKLRKRNAYLEMELQRSIGEMHQKNRVLTIEMALGKVSARTIAMRNSAELSETSAVLFHEIKELEINAIRTGVGIFDDANDAMEIWLTTVSDSQEVINILDYVNLHIHPVFENIIPARKEGKPYVLTVLSGVEVRQYNNTMSTYLSIAQHQALHEKEFFYSFFFPQGALNVIAIQPLTEEECNIMIQFAQVFGLIYMRFLDLQKAEAQTREALRQTSLDRVRAEIASMRTTDDLQRIIPLIWRELGTLGVPFFRCGVFIISEMEQLVRCYMSTPEGESFAVLNLSFEGTETARNVVENWRQQKVYTDHWNREQFQDWVKSMLEQGQIENVQQYQVDESPPESLSLQYIPFSQGMLYVGSHDALEDSQIDLVKSIADSFSVAYARYEDFKQLEDAKNRVEATLSELKAAQSQLIQSEKMASLGVLTAGIAHEIQNPLNFVNNFSEVNKELLTEMSEEIDKGNFDEVKVIANDVIDNEGKINHHGKRAEAIVKGMLLHSRSTTATKEPTDINALADEYLRLSYHGLRAKDKSFNATLKMDFDETIGKIKIVPQDIGRVLMNLYNNAFYAINPLTPEEGIADPSTKKEPTIWVDIKKMSDKVIISVRDNGPGISQKVVDKIFQPFFTTKPTGQGTGLGLSLSYDIVKAHGGELKVETNEGEGAVFIIHLPVE